MRLLLAIGLASVPLLVGCGPSGPDGSPDYYEVDGEKRPDESASSSSGADGSKAPSSGAQKAPPSAPPSGPFAGGASDDPGGEGKAEPAPPPSPREAATTTVWERRIVLHLDDAANTGWATIDNGDPGDEVWLDRSFNGGADWEPKLGDTSVPAEQRGTRTDAYAVDDPAPDRTGVLRACGKAGDRPEIACTSWWQVAAAAR